MRRVVTSKLLRSQHLAYRTAQPGALRSVPHRTLVWQPVRSALVASSVDIVEKFEDVRDVVEDFVVDTAADIADLTVPYMGTLSSVALARLQDLYEFLVDRTGYDPDLDGQVTPPTADPFQADIASKAIRSESSGGFFSEILRPIKGMWEVISPAKGIQLVLAALTVKTGLPLWGVIVLTTVGLRLATWPITLMQVRAAARKVHTMGEQEKFQMEEQRIQRETDPLVQKAKQQELSARKKALSKKYRTETWRLMAGIFLYTPVLLAMTAGIRRIVRVDPAALSGGFGWIKDLSSPDVLLVLPSCMALGWVYFAYRARQAGNLPPSIHMVVVPLVLGFTPFIVMWLAKMSAGPVLYLTTSFSVTLLLNRVRGWWVVGCVGCGVVLA